MSATPGDEILPPIEKPLDKPHDPRNALRCYVGLDLFVRVLIWSTAGVLASYSMGRLAGSLTGNPFSGDLAVALRWGTYLACWVLLYNLFYVALLVVLRLPIPTPREGRYSMLPGQPISLQVIWSSFVGVLTTARLQAPFPGFLVFHISQLPPMCWLMNSIFGPRSKSAFATDPRVIDPHMVTIGRNVILGLNATVAGHYVERNLIVFKRTVIEDDVIVGGSVRILGGVHVKRGAVITAGSVVLPGTVIGENEFWWGVPARKFRTLPPAPYLAK
jgi:hypothetical protein